LRQQENLERHLEEMRQALLEAERAVAEYEGQLAAKNEEIGRLSHSAAEIVERVSADLGKRLESIEKKTATDEDLKRSLEEIQRDISNIATVSAVVRKGEAIDAATMVKFAERGSEDSSVESNIAQVKVKQAKASGLKSTLARLKELQKGAQNDGQ
jgi:chromosome segregation ATPase